MDIDTKTAEDCYYFFSPRNGILPANEAHRSVVCVLGSAKLERPARGLGSLACEVESVRSPESAGTRSSCGSPVVQYCS